MTSAMKKVVVGAALACAMASPAQAKFWGDEVVESYESPRGPAIVKICTYRFWFVTRCSCATSAGDPADCPDGAANTAGNSSATTVRQTAGAKDRAAKAARVEKKDD